MKFELNHKIVEVPDSQNDYRLLWVLRDHFNLTGPKFGCGIGECGACSVHVNGDVQRSCSLTLKDVDGQQVITLEGLSTDEKLHPVQQAWINENVPQCGYCQNGQIMTAVAAIEQSPALSKTEIYDAMDGVRCRCGTQKRIKAAVDEARTVIAREASNG